MCLLWKRKKKCKNREKNEKKKEQEKMRKTVCVSVSVRAVCVCACVRVFSDIDDDNSPIYTAKRAGCTDPLFNQRVPGDKQQSSGEQNMNVCGVCVCVCV